MLVKSYGSRLFEGFVAQADLIPDHEVADDHDRQRKNTIKDWKPKDGLLVLMMLSCLMILKINGVSLYDNMIFLDNQHILGSCVQCRRKTSMCNQCSDVHQSPRLQRLSKYWWALEAAKLKQSMCHSIVASSICYWSICQHNAPHLPWPIQAKR